MIELMLLPLMAGIGLSFLAGPLGCFILWRRMAYFGDTLAHASLLGVSLSIALSINTTLTVIAVCGLVGLSLTYSQAKTSLTSDALLGILSHSALAIGLLVASFFPNRVFNLHAFLMGDILTVTPQDLGLIIGCVTIGVAALVLCWRVLLNTTIDEDLAKVEGIATYQSNLVLLWLTAMLIAISIKLVGVLLITALIIIPASTARLWAKSPEAMAIMAVIFCQICIITGLVVSYFYNVPTGATIVTCASGLFLLSMLIQKRAK